MQLSQQIFPFLLNQMILCTYLWLAFFQREIFKWETIGKKFRKQVQDQGKKARSQRSRKELLLTFR